MRQINATKISSDQRAQPLEPFVELLLKIIYSLAIHISIVTFCM